MYVFSKFINKYIYSAFRKNIQIKIVVNTHKGNLVYKKVLLLCSTEDIDIKVWNNIRVFKG